VPENGEPILLSAFGPWDKAKDFINPTPIRIAGYDMPLAYGKHRFEIDDSIAICEACHMMIRATEVDLEKDGVCTPIFGKDLGL